MTDYANQIQSLQPCARCKTLLSEEEYSRYCLGFSDARSAESLEAGLLNLLKSARSSVRVHAGLQQVLGLPDTESITLRLMDDLISDSMNPVSEETYSYFVKRPSKCTRWRRLRAT